MVSCTDAILSSVAHNSKDLAYSAAMSKHSHGTIPSSHMLLRRCGSICSCITHTYILPYLKRVITTYTHWRKQGHVLHNFSHTPYWLDLPLQNPRYATGMSLRKQWYYITQTH